MPEHIDLSEQVALLIDNHLRLDAAIGDQLQGVIGDTEYAATMLITESRKLSDAANVLETMLGEADCSDNVRHYYDMMIEHNSQLAAGIAEILGHTQFQDGVRQRIERIETAIAKRNELFLAFAKSMVGPDSVLSELPLKMREVLEEYVAIESRHAPTLAAGQSVDEFKFEMF
jgi:methyl-accepting chemotaxis protein